MLAGVEQSYLGISRFLGPNPTFDLLTAIVKDVKMLIGVLDPNFVCGGASRDENVGGWDGLAALAGGVRQIIRRGPDVFVDLQFGQAALQVL